MSPELREHKLRPPLTIKQKRALMRGSNKRTVLGALGTLKSLLYSPRKEQMASVEMARLRITIIPALEKLRDGWEVRDKILRRREEIADGAK